MSDPVVNLREQLAAEDAAPLSNLDEIERDLFRDREGRGPPDDDEVLSYAYCLTRCSSRQERNKGLAMLENLLKSNPDNDKALYFLALGQYRVKHYVQAKELAEQLLRKDPTHVHANALVQLADDHITRDGLIGMGIAGGAALAAVGLVGLVGIALLKR